MIADISGFTKFSSEMCARGAVGLDSLYNVTNDFMGQFVDIVYEFDGDGEGCHHFEQVWIIRLIL